jgi:hypothetical protein
MMNSKRCGWVAAAWLLVVPHVGHAIILADPVNFQVKQTISGATLGIPNELGAALFSADGSVLYVVGDADRVESAVYAVPVIRDPQTQEILDLGPAASVTKVFDGVSSMGGLDAGLDVGPGGTLFYAYWWENRLAERPGGFAGAETSFDLTAIGIPVSGGGLTFSPLRCDPTTVSPQLQVSTYDLDEDGDPRTGARDIYDVALGAGSNGLYAPTGSTLFATLPPGTVEMPIGAASGMHYVPAGTLAGDLLYASFDVGEVRYLGIDQGTGLPIDAGTLQPQLGTTNPVDQPFVSDLGVGPLGMDFDPITHDLFVTTAQGIPLNTIIQIGGFTGTTLPPVDCATVTTSTTISGGTTTTTTLPGCTAELAFAPLRCRIGALSAAIEAAGVPGKRLDSSLTRLAKAIERLSVAEEAVDLDKVKQVRKQIGKAARFVGAIGKRLGSARKGPKVVADEQVRATLATAAAAIALDLQSFRDTF